VVLQSDIEGLEIAGTLSPRFGFERDGRALVNVERTVAGARPRLVLVGLGFPKQELVARRLRDALPDAWFMSVGITFSFLAGELERAPERMQALGLEWLHRLGQQPHLAGRYLRDLPFALHLFAHALVVRISRATEARQET
jgi:N-acetylglucosaminyldiphosphoundecaprenol N-acetyl-beta-D-mannosaminyltransferase